LPTCRVAAAFSLVIWLAGLVTWSRHPSKSSLGTDSESEWKTLIGGCYSTLGLIDRALSKGGLRSPRGSNFSLIGYENGVTASGKLEKGESDSSSENVFATMRVIETQLAEFGLQSEAGLLVGEGDFSGEA
jgi:hypothetical protein